MLGLPEDIDGVEDMDGGAGLDGAEDKDGGGDTDGAEGLDGGAALSAPDGFEEFALSVLPKLLRLARRSGATDTEGEDIAAEALARAYASWGRVSGLDYREGWVLRTASNLLCDRARRRRLSNDPRATVTVPAFDHAVVVRAELVTALSRLSRAQRETVVMHHLAGMSVAEVATATGISDNSVKTHLSRGMAKLRSQLSPVEE